MREDLRNARKGKGLSILETAQAVGISYSGYCNIELGKRNPSVPLAKRIAKVLDVEWTTLFGERKSIERRKLF